MTELLSSPNSLTPKAPFRAPVPHAGGGWHAIAYSLAQGFKVGNYQLWKAMASKNTCKTCALGMGGQRGGMINEEGHFPEFCKKSIQAMQGDLQPALDHTTFTQAKFSYLQDLTPKQLEDLGRLHKPLVAREGADHYEEANWDEAIESIAQKMKASSAERSFFYVSGRSSNEAGFLTQLFARQYGTNNVNNCSYYCHQASGVGLAQMLGSGTGTVTIADLQHCDCYILIGANPASNHPRLMRNLMNIRRQGGEVIVINTIREKGLERFSVPSDPMSLLGSGTDIASYYVQPHCGGDLALFALIASEIIEQKAYDQDFLKKHVPDYQDVLATFTKYSREGLLTQAGVDLETVHCLVDKIISARRPIFAWAMGVTHHLHGVETVKMIAQLAVLCGALGKEGAGLMPLRGHSNVQGMGTVGVIPALKKEFFENVEGIGLSLPAETGKDTMACMEAAAAGDIDFAFCLGGNLFGSNPASEFARDSLSQIDQIVYLNTSLNTGHIHGRGKETWILPVQARDEESQATTQESMFSFVRLSDGGDSRHPETRAESDIICSIAEQVLERQNILNWTQLRGHQAIRNLIARVVPGLAEIEDIEKTKREFTIPGRSHTISGVPASMRLQFIDIPDQPKLNADELYMMTIRSEGQFNTVVYEEHDRYRGTTQRNVILMNTKDRERLGLQEYQRVIVENTQTQKRMSGVYVQDLAIRSGNTAMYYPEANCLISKEVDPASRTPSFKRVCVRIIADD